MTSTTGRAGCSDGYGRICGVTRSPGYTGAHQRLGPIGGQSCIDCGRPALDWSLDHTAPRARLMTDETGRHRGRPFSLNLVDYHARCRRCHILYDGGRARQQGAGGTNARLTEAQVREIRRLVLTSGTSQRAIGEQFGVCPSTVSLIKRHRTWKHLGDAEANS